MASSSIYMEMNKTYEVNPITPISATGNKKNFSSEPILCADGYEEASVQLYAFKYFGNCNLIVVLVGFFANGYFYSESHRYR